MIKLFSIHGVLSAITDMWNFIFSRAPKQTAAQAPYQLETDPGDEVAANVELDATQQLPSTISSASSTSPHRDTKLQALRNKVADTASDILDRFESINRDGMEFDCARDRIAALELLMGCDFHLVSDLAEKMEGSDRFYLLGDGLRDAVWPVDIATITRKEDCYSLVRVFSVDPKELRGRIRLSPKRCVIVAYGEMSDDGKWWAEQEICGEIAGQWTQIETERVVRSNARTTLTCITPHGADRVQALRASIDMHFSAFLTERYSWHVAFGSETKGPRLILPTNPKGCLDIFRTRQKREGETRRSALRHWVMEHYRDVGDDLTYVRNHLRGKCSRFLWKDIDCELMVSAFDLEKNEFFRQQAADWRAARKHNRVRVRLKRSAA